MKNIALLSDQSNATQVLKVGRFKPISFPLRVITWLVIAAQINVAVPLLAEVMLAGAINATEAASKTVAANLKQEKPVPAPPLWSGKIEEQIGSMRLFAEPLLPVGKTVSADNQALLSALQNFSNRTNRDDFSSLEKYLAAHPKSPWRASLLTSFGLFLKEQGYFSRALQNWNEAWDLAHQANEGAAKLVADRAGAEYVRLAAAVGRADDLEAMLKRMGERQVDTSVYPMVAAARNSLSQMRKEPALMYTCGPQALSRIRDAQGKSIFPPEIQDCRGTKHGFSLYELMHLANRIQMDYQMAYRTPKAKVVFPAVVHLKVGHYVAVAKEYQGRYLIQDPTSGFDDLWITAAALDDESSGYCLIRNGELPVGWKPVSEADGQKIFGRGEAPDFDKHHLKSTSPKCAGGCPPGHGMPYYSFHTMAVSLNVQDTPLGYNPAFGPAVNFTLTYNQRDDTQPTTILYPNVGRNWTFDWLSYVEDDLSASAATLTRYLPGGGQDTYVFDTGTSSFLSDYDSHTKIIRSGSGASATYEVQFADGSKMFYAKSDGATSGKRKVFLTGIRDPQGNQITFTWSGTLNPRLDSIRDAVNRTGSTTKITYVSDVVGNAGYHRIWKVTDHFDSANANDKRTAVLEYSADGRLVKITDVIGMVSTFNYDFTSGLMIGMTTPYGTTAFAGGGTGAYRWLEATDPLGQKERLEFNQSTTLPGIGVSEDEAVVPKVTGVLPPFQNLNLYYRNSFFWSKKVMQEMGGVVTPQSYAKADIYHWCHSVNGLASGTLESLKRPLENRIWFRYPGQGPNAVDAWTEGTSTQPAYVARVLDDGKSVQLSRFDYNDFGKLTSVTNPVGKITRFVYFSNGIDLKEVRQDNPTSLTPDVSGGDLMASFTYDTTYPRLVKTATDASGQATTFNYGSYGQISSVVDAKSKTTSFAYTYPSHPGFLHKITGPTTVSGATTTFIPDAYDRVQSVTGPDNYTVSYTYDALDRATKVTYPDTTTEEVKYRFLDPILTQDRQKRWTGMEYDAQRHLTATKDSLGRVTQYNWCACGDLESIIDANTNITSWVRDLQGRVTQKIYPDASTTTYTYENTTSRLKNVTDAMGQTTHYDYFIDDTLKNVSYLNATFATPSVSFTYDTKYSRIRTMVDGVGTTTYNYNPITTTPTLGAGRLGSVVSTFPSATISYTYDELGRITTRSIGSVQTTWGFDDLGRLSTLNDGLGSFSYSYHTFGAATPVDAVTYPNGQSVEVTAFGSSDLQNQGRLKTIHNKLNTTTTISKFDYSYDIVGRIASWTRQFDSATPTFYKFQYDLVGQLLGAALTNGTPASPTTLVKQYLYSYDNLGNRATESVDSPAAASTAAFNNLNQLTKRTPGQRIPFSGTLSPAPRDVTINGFPATMPTTTSFQGVAAASVDNPTVTVVATDGDGNKNIKQYKVTTVSAAGDPTTLAYDLNGNLVFSATGTTEDTYDWDAANRMIAIEHHVSGAMVSRSEFSYDGMGRRVKIAEKNSSGAVTSTKAFLWCGMQLCQQRDATGTTVARQYFATGEKRGTTKYFYTRDHLGSVREVLDNSGVLVARYDYDPYGTRTTLTGSFDCDFGFTGHYLHGSSGLYLAPLRSYDPVTGRWLSRDPIAEAGGLNLHAYVDNDPINYIDPLGDTLVVSDHPFRGQNPNDYGPYVKNFVDGSTRIKNLNQLTPELLKELMDQTYDRLKNKQHTDLDRCEEKAFDTKIWKGKDADRRQYYEFEGEVYADNEINYMGIGMFEGWMGDPLMLAEFGVMYWKFTEYGEFFPSSGTTLWLHKGFREFHNRSRPPVKFNPDDHLWLGL